MKTLNNPAGRLLEVLKRAKAFQPPNAKALEAWAKILEVPPNDIPHLLTQFGKVLTLPKIVQERIKSQEEINHSIYLKWVPKVESCFKSINLETTIHSFTSNLDEAALDGLEFCSELLSRVQPEIEIDEKEIGKITKQIHKLQDEIIQSEIDNQYKFFMLEKLEELLKALQEYRIMGVEPIDEVFVNTFGRLATNQQIYEETKDTEIGGKFWSVLTRALLLTSLAVTTIQLGQWAQNLLPNQSEEKVQQQCPKGPEGQNPETVP